MGVSSKGEKITFESWMKITGIFVSLLVFALLYTMNTPVQMTMQGKASLACFGMVFVLWKNPGLPKEWHYSLFQNLAQLQNAP